MYHKICKAGGSEEGYLYWINGNLADTGWVILNAMNGFTPYRDAERNRIRVRKIGQVVYLKGSVSPPANNTLGSSANDDQMQLCQLPAGFDSTSFGRIFVCQGSRTAVWTLRISEGGIVIAERYRTHNGYETPGTDDWMPFCVSFIDD